MSGQQGREQSELAYLYDGSLEGLLCAVFAAYERKEHPSEVVPQAVFQPRLGQTSLSIASDYDRALRVKAGIERRAGRDAFVALMRAAACDDYETGTVVYRFVRYVMDDRMRDRSNPVLDDQSNPIVGAVRRLATRATNESEKMRQFVRFAHLENGVWYARCNPNASVVPFVMGYFAARLNDQPFIIYDENHQIAGLYDGQSWQLVSGAAVPPVAASQHDELMQEAWKRFYDALSVDARFNPELRRHFMPTRLWRNLPEMHPRTLPNPSERP